MTAPLTLEPTVERPGDYPARARIIVTDTSGNDQKGLLWGIRSRHYSSDATAALVIEAESMTPLNGATVTALAGASGGDVVKMASLPGGSWTSILSTTLRTKAGAGVDHSGVGTVAWSNPNNVTLDEASSPAVAPNLPAGGGTSHYLQTSDYGLSIPAGATINGIEVAITRWGDGGGGAIEDVHVQLLKAGVIQATDKASASLWPSDAPAVQVYGGATDLWGGTWTAADINDAGFGVSLSCKNTNASILFGANVSSIAITVYYATAISGSLTHTGSYRVWARCYSASATPQLRLAWGVGSLSVPVTNDPVTLPGSGAFYLLDLGEIRLDAPPVGANQWFGAFQALGNSGDPVSIDCVYLQPLDDGAGQLTYVNEPPASSIAASGNPTTGADNAGVGTVAWANPGNITAQDSSDASATLTPTAVSHYLEASGFGLSIPAGATIQGIVAQISRIPSAVGAVQDATVKLMKAGALVGSNLALAGSWSGSSTTQSYGSSTELWGTTWTPTDVNNSGFGVALSVESLVSHTVEAFVDWIGVTVYYTLASGFTVAQDAVIYANENTELRHDGMFRQGPSAGPYGPVSQVVGDLVRIPPSGVEGRPVQVFVKPTRGDGNALPDDGLDSFTVQVKYRPSWIFRP